MSREVDPNRPSSSAYVAVAHLANALMIHGLLQSRSAGLGLLPGEDIMQHIVMSCKVAFALQ